MSAKPLIAITAGDPLGIGPEVTVQALKDPQVRAVCRVLLIGEPRTLQTAGFTDELAGLLPIEHPQSAPHQKAEPCRWAGEVSFKALQTACKLASQEQVKAVVTAPISKQSWGLAGINFTGHTEFLRAHYGKTALMMFSSGALKCALVTEHFAIKDLPKVITPQRIERACLDFNTALKKMGIKRPHIALSSLNPHGGDNGRFGKEERLILLPALETLRRKGVLVQGPFPVDSLWLAHRHGNFDGILCMYHDQALLGLKLAAKEPIVHITAGLDFLRVSPTHGTAFDIAGKHRADPSSMKAALLFAARHIK